MLRRAAQAFVACAVLVTLAFADEDKTGKLEAPLPAVAAFQTRAGKLPLIALRGRAVLLLQMSSYYPKCTDAVPDMNKLHDLMGPKGLTLLGVSPEEAATLEPWMKKNGVKYGYVIVDTKTDEQMKRDWPAPGYPHAYLIDPEGIVVWHGHPQNLAQTPDQIRPYLADVSQPPELPASLADAQKLLDAGTWAAAGTALQASIDGGKLSKEDAGWARGTIEWIAKRRTRAFPDAANMESKGFWWDAWHVYDEYPRKFAGMEGTADATAKADVIRKNPEAQDDLRNGDDFWKAKGFFETGKFAPAKLILERLAKMKNTRIADRAKELLTKVPAK